MSVSAYHVVVALDDGVHDVDDDNKVDDDYAICEVGSQLG